MPDEKPEGVITITLTLTPGQKGYGLHVAVVPEDTYSDTVIDACSRAARFFENREHTVGLVQTLEAYRLAREQAERAARMAIKPFHN